MDIVDKSLTIDVDLNSEVWDRVINSTKNHDDISLTVEYVNINMTKLIIPESISSVTFKYCVFNEAIEISGLDKGRYFGIKS